MIGKISYCCIYFLFFCLFAYSGPFNEMVLLGVLAIRLQGLNKTLQWDGPNMVFTNISPSEELRIVSSNDFKVIGGHPHFDVKYQKFNAMESSTEYIRHTCRDGWKLPDMPSTYRAFTNTGIMTPST